MEGLQEAKKLAENLIQTVSSILYKQLLNEVIFTNKNVCKNRTNMIVKGTTVHRIIR